MNGTDSRIPEARDGDALRTRFASLRTVRAADAGTFGAALAAARNRARDARAGHTRRRLVFAGAAALPLLIALTLFARTRAQVRADMALARELDALVGWHSPTGVLLATPYAHNLRSVPALQQSLITLPLPSTGEIQ